jgi:hypothetical protein
VTDLPGRKESEDSEREPTEVDGLAILRAIKQLIDDRAQHLRTRNRTIWKVQKASLWVVSFAVIISQKLGWTSWIKRVERKAALKQLERETALYQATTQILRAEAAERKERNRRQARHGRKKRRKR